MQEESSYNKRQITLMLVMIEDYLQSKLPFYHLVGNLNALLDLLQDISPLLKDDILTDINHLEMYRALMSINNKSSLDDDEKNMVNNILYKLKTKLSNLNE